MNKTIIFISGWQVPKIIAKSPLVWDDFFWQDYQRIYISSRTPTSDYMVAKELDRLQNIVYQFDNPVLAGHSLGAWWAANLACRIKIRKLVLWTPLGDTSVYPVFNVSRLYHPSILHPNPNNIGVNKTAIFIAKRDFIVPPFQHCTYLVHKFKATTFTLNGGHFWQSNHSEGLSFMKNWIEKDL